MGFEQILEPKYICYKQLITLVEIEPKSGQSKKMAEKEIIKGGRGGGLEREN